MRPVNPDKNRNNRILLSEIDWVTLIYHAIIGATIAKFWIEHI